jgi:hypothetical protein
LYQKYLFEIKRNSKVQAIVLGKKSYKEIQIKFSEILTELFFLQNFHHPVDHLKNRTVYETYRKNERQHKANSSFFLRKIYEDGVPFPDGARSDKYMRTGLDTLRLNLMRDDIFLDPDVIYDLDWSIEQFGKALERGHDFYLKGFTKWRSKNKNILKFYEKIIESPLAAKKAKAKATQELKDFVYQKQAEVYSFLSHRPEWIRSLYALETILYNEVGSVDPSQLERKKVIEVVLNRYQNKYYHSLDKDQALTHHLSKKSKMNFPWLNILFKQREFSFTFYFIRGVTEIFCPNISNWSMKLRSENLKLSWEALKSPEPDGRVTRYFSQNAMVGRIDMSSVWGNFLALPESPGNEVSADSQLQEDFRNEKFIYLYQFFNRGQRYLVLKFGGDKRVVTKSGRSYKFYQYRDPYLFRYFGPRTNK